MGRGYNNRLNRWAFRMGVDRPLTLAPTKQRSQGDAKGTQNAANR